MTSPHEALAALEQQKANTERNSQLGNELGQRMMQVLESRGELLIAKWGLYGGISGLYGSATPGKRISQSTLPVPIDGQSFVALRHPIDIMSTDEPDYSVELIKTQLEGPGYCVIEPTIDAKYEPGSFMAEHLRKDGLGFTHDDVIAGCLKPDMWTSVRVTLEIGGDSNYSTEQLEATTALVDYIEASLEPLSEDWQYITRKLPYEPKIANGVRMRDGANHIKDLDIDLVYIDVL